MIKRYLVILMAVCLLCACSENINDDLNGGSNPLSECVISSPLHAGGEGFVQWNGFLSNASLLLSAVNGVEYQLEINIITPSGLSFRIPTEVPEGKYMMVLLQETRLEVGAVDILPAESPVSNVQMTSEAVHGDEVLVSGFGFETGCIIVLVASDGKKYEMEASVEGEGVSFEVDEELPEGEYDVYLIQDGADWLLSSSFRVVSALVVKSLKSIRLYSPYIGGDELMHEWLVGEGDVTLSQYIVEDGIPELNVYDRYSYDGEGYFELVDDGFESSNNMEVSYERNDGGYVISSDVLRYGDDTPTLFEWSYNAGGYLTEIKLPSKAFRTIEYDEENIILFGQIGFEYSEESLLNHSCAADVVWAYMSLSDTVEPFIYFPYLMGWYAPSSRLLPLTMLKPSPTGDGKIACTLKYDFDGDGYVVSMSWSEGTSPYRVEFEY